jgi:hypothetical protein
MAIMKGKRNFYWKCEFECKDNSVILKTIYGKTTHEAFKYTHQMGLRIGATPKYDTLREATDEEVKEFKRMIKHRVKEKE